MESFNAPARPGPARTAWHGATGALTWMDVLLAAGALDFLGLNVYFGWSARHGVPDGAKDPSIERDAAYTIVETSNQFLPPGPPRVSNH